MSIQDVFEWSKLSVPRHIFVLAMPLHKIMVQAIMPFSEMPFTKPGLWTGLDHGLDTGLTAFLSAN